MAAGQRNALNLKVLAWTNGVPGAILQRKIRGQHFRKDIHAQQTSIQFSDVRTTVAMLCQIKDKLVRIPRFGLWSAEDILQNFHAKSQIVNLSD